jgi:hypothetical protein
MLLLNSTIFWVVTPCSSVKVQRFGMKHRLHLQNSRVSQARGQQKAGGKVCYFYGLRLTLTITLISGPQNKVRPQYFMFT